MPGSRIGDAVLVTIALTAAAAAVALRHVHGVEALAELVFAGVVATSILLVGRLVVRAFRAAVAQRSAVRALQRRPITEVVRQAVADERARLAADIETVVRTYLQAIRARAEQALRDNDPGPPLREIQRLGRAATVELRRLLGLLREAHSSAPEPPPVRTSAFVRPVDLVLAAGAVALALTEHYVENTISGWPVPGSNHVVAVVGTVAAAATLALRRRAPAAGGALCGLVMLAAAAVGHPVGGGFWIVAVPGVLCYTAMRRLTWPDFCGAMILLATVTAAIAWRDPINMPINAETVLIAGVAGLLVALADRRRAADRTVAVRRSAELSAAAARAVHAERLAVAREMHDVVSHAVGVITMQAAAAELLRPTSRERATDAILVVRSVAEDALGELNVLVGVMTAGTLGGGPASRPSSTSEAAPMPVEFAGHDRADLAALVERMRSAGLTVQLEAPEFLGGDTGTTVYRIIQEALTNVLRHAPGSAVAVTVDNVADGLHVEVRDDGPGPAGAARQGFGLAGIAERVRHLGGTLHTSRGGDGTGFRIDARLPVPPPT